MRRICIFSFYEKDGFVDEYVFYLLEQIRINVKKMIIVVNGVIQNCFIDKLNEITDTIIYRDNLGFDAGAYKSVLMHHLSQQEINEYNEIILCNNTFYGPFISINHILEVMEKRNYDFWGMNYVSPTIVDYMQSYFLAFREGIIKSGTLYDFFNENIDELNNDIDDAYVEFEAGITQYIFERGFSIGAFATSSICDIYKSSNYGIKKYGVPLIKNKVLEREYLNDNFLDALQYVERYTQYDVNLIKSHIVRKNIVINDYNKSELDTKEYTRYSLHNSMDIIRKFSEKFDYIYIYGAGVIARKVYRFYKLQNVKAFVISDGQKKITDLYGLPVVFISQITNSKNTGTIVAMNSDNSEQIKCSVSKFDNIIYP